MPFDDTNYKDPGPEPPPVPRRTSRGETVLLILLAALAFAALLMPLTLSGFGDAVRAIGGR